MSGSACEGFGAGGRLYGVTQISVSNSVSGSSVGREAGTSGAGTSGAGTSSFLVFLLGDVWSKVIQLNVAETIEYRFFVGRFLECDKTENGVELTIVRWETPLNARCLKVNGPLSLPVAEFGNFNGFNMVTSGWLTGQTCMQLRIHDDPIVMWKSRYRNQMYRIKCVPMDYRPNKMSHSDVEEDSIDGPLCSSTRTTVLVLNDREYNSGSQDAYGTVFNNEDYLVFKVQSFNCQHLGFQLEFFVHDPKLPPDEAPKYIGFTHILPLEQQRSLGVRLRLPIMGLRHKPIGEIYIDYLLIKPFTTHKCYMDVSYQGHWGMKGKTLDIGHRGMGVSQKHIELVHENTLASFSAAAIHGADMVEFDVMLTKDHEPLVFHDYTVHLSYKKGFDEEAQLFEIPIKDLTLAQLHSMKLSQPCCVAGSQIDLSKENDEQKKPFPTLKQVLLEADKRLAFFMEVKHPLTVESGKVELDQYFDHNLHIDKILEVVFNYAGSRKIVFASFDADACIILQQKQNRYPVMFLTCGQTVRWEPYKDFRCRNFPVAISFALSEGLMGVGLNLEIVLQDKDMSVMKKAHETGLVTFVWGEEANNKEMIKQLRRHGADGIIYDRIDFHRPRDNVQFELEDTTNKTLMKEFKDVGQISK
ncbi:glycerophosphocholine phosphodiesterase GPCPD1-like [Gigantopelta aegis]|uniref:glycerophosphocholine phosphodiesterase GPCPD1-like n=1 Tax=Gigantopelta aegis TaxID=1735272 RepID=UPI001B888D6D|nr:glycerophosphocholine phosphodiesterase GPCPD1-like [Gigantopelta aegis]